LNMLDQSFSCLISALSAFISGSLLLQYVHIIANWALLVKNNPALSRVIKSNTGVLPMQYGVF
jgi:hypothetical protein